MKKTYLNKSLPEFKNLFKEKLQHEKKIRALDNYSLVAPVRHVDYIKLLKGCLESGFLDEKESEFLNYLTDKYEMEHRYFIWAHKTNWVKGQIGRANAARASKPMPQLLLDLSKKAELNFPREVVARMKRMGSFQHTA